MALYVKSPKTCRNKKHSAAFLTPPDSSLSSSSGSLSSSTNSERKLHPKRKPLRYKGHTTLIAAAIPRRKKLKTKKSSGSDSDAATQPRKNNNLPGEINRNSLYSSCKSFFLCCKFCVLIEKSRARDAVWGHVNVAAISSRTKVAFFERKCRWSSSRNLKKTLITKTFHSIFSCFSYLQQCHGSEWTSAVHSLS